MTIEEEKPSFVTPVSSQHRTLSSLSDFTMIQLDLGRSGTGEIVETTNLDVNDVVPPHKLAVVTETINLDKQRSNSMLASMSEIHFESGKNVGRTLKFPVCMSRTI
jgi:hypothetical protein